MTTVSMRTTGWSRTMVEQCWTPVMDQLQLPTTLKEETPGCDTSLPVIQTRDTSCLPLPPQLLNLYIQQVIPHQRNVIERSEPLQLHLICDLIQFMNLVMKIFNLFLMQHYVSINHETQILPRIKSDISKYVK